MLTKRKGRLLSGKHRKHRTPSTQTEIWMQSQQQLETKLH